MPTLRDARLVDVSVQEDATFAEAARALATAGVPAIAVLGLHRRLLGVFSENELIAGLLPPYLRELRHTAFALDDPDVLSRRAGTVAGEPVTRHMSRAVALEIDTSATHAAERFLHAERAAMAVVERNEFVGMLPRSELARLLLEQARLTPG